jgi:hypothetical protein
MSALDSAGAPWSAITTGSDEQRIGHEMTGHGAAARLLWAE